MVGLDLTAQLHRISWSDQSFGHRARLSSHLMAFRRLAAGFCLTVLESTTLHRGPSRRTRFLANPRGGFPKRLYRPIKLHAMPFRQGRFSGGDPNGARSLACRRCESIAHACQSFVFRGSLSISDPERRKAQLIYRDRRHTEPLVAAAVGIWHAPGWPVLPFQEGRRALL